MPWLEVPWVVWEEQWKDTWGEARCSWQVKYMRGEESVLIMMCSDEQLANHIVRLHNQEIP